MCACLPSSFLPQLLCIPYDRGSPGVFNGEKTFSQIGHIGLLYAEFEKKSFHH